jgi:DNA-binding NtrC family response regulator
LRTWIENAGFDVVEFARGLEALRDGSSEWTAVCLDLDLEDMAGMDLLRHLRARDVLLPVLVVAADQNLDSAVQAVRFGAYDYVTKPFDGHRVIQALQRVAEYQGRLSQSPRPGQLQEEARLIGDIVGQSAPMRSLARQLRRVLQADIPVCIFGETGTGKELVARAIHEQGTRAKGPFIAVNCAAFAESLLESELFGHERGAFTGAFSSHRGFFEQAQGGTLFLDEVGEMSAPTQVRLLRTLQERIIRRVGGTAEIRIDVRIITATHRDLLAEVKAGRFREDLYYRLAVYPVHVPPLRERTSDIPVLVRHLLMKSTGSGQDRPKHLSHEALDALLRYRWPGNVRELENILQRAVLSCDGPQIELAHLPAELRALVLPILPESLPPLPRLPLEPLHDVGVVVPLRELERREILKALVVTRGSVTKAAKLLGLGRATLYRRLGELRIPSGPEREESSPEEDSGQQAPRAASGT